MLSNIACIVRNISLIIYYKTTDISNTFVEYMRVWIVDGQVEYETIDEPRYISQDYEDRVEESLKRNKWGFPTK
tara:strand:- start:353 stop:574 length:222 start_codon:yes stop_codon:yes gene_type:complete